MASTYSFWLCFIVILIAVISKIFAGYLGGRIIQLSKLKSLGIGIILNDRGVMVLVIAAIGYKYGLIDQGLFSTLVLMGVITTIVTSYMFQKCIIPNFK